MSLFTKRRKIRNENKRKRIERLEEGCKQIEKSMNKMLSHCKGNTYFPINKMV